MGFCGPDDEGAHIPVISDESNGDAITAYADERRISLIQNGFFDPNWSPMLFNDGIICLLDKEVISKSITSLS